MVFLKDEDPHNGGLHPSRRTFEIVPSHKIPLTKVTLEGKEEALFFI
jgi:hypothetical protein